MFSILDLSLSTAKSPSISSRLPTRSSNAETPRKAQKSYGAAAAHAVVVQPHPTGVMYRRNFTVAPIQFGFLIRRERRDVLPFIFFEEP